jgi:hypothetical protein
MKVWTSVERELRLIARRRIEQGLLPSAGPSRTWGGKGTGQLCALCDQPIQPGDVELEVEEVVQGAGRTFQFHSACQFLWQVECAGPD